MKLIISAKLQGIFETYNVFVDGEKVLKVRGDKETTLQMSDEEHQVQLKSGSGKSSIIKINKPKQPNETITLKFKTVPTRPFQEGYFELIED